MTDNEKFFMFFLLVWCVSRQDMSDIRIFKGDGKRAEDVTGELGDRIKALIYEYSGRMPLAAAVGVLHLVAYEITTDSD